MVLNNKIKKGGAGTNDPRIAFEILKQAGIDIKNEIDFKAIVKDLFNLLYDIFTGGEKTEAEFTRRVLEQLYNITGGNNCAVFNQLCSNRDLLIQIKEMYTRLYTTLENGVFSYATNAIAVVPGFGPAAVAVINALKIGKDVKKGIVDKFQKAVTIVNDIQKNTVKVGGTKKIRKHKLQKKITTKQIKDIAETYLQFLNLILYVKKNYKTNNKTNNKINNKTNNKTNNKINNKTKKL
jgi:hypothetical protein